MPPEDGGRVSFTVGDGEVGLRLDQALAARVPGLSRRKARLLLDIGGVFVDGRRVKVAGRIVRAGEKIVANLGGALDRATPRTGRAARAEDDARLPPFAIVFEDEDLVVIDKPSGLLTAPTPESDRGNLAGLLARRPGAGPVHVVHRIDLETSGLLVFAKTEDANRVLSEKFRVHDLGREYLAVAAGAFPEGVRVVERPVGGKRALTHVAIEERLGTRATALRCRLETGRTHQIRLHLLAEGHPVLGDPRYGGAPISPRPPRMALHATLLAFAHPRTGAPLSFTSPWPPEMAAWLETFRNSA
ncbi:MAG TPA: RluA family pseudouridine synthase [Polyangia bacterium]|jgi:23S rRNA pseudouridine1911/1915/1917 synthase|nr:RluA family pseudouridine synthase [Polyangia bacterium]